MSTVVAGSLPVHQTHAEKAVVPMRSGCSGLARSAPLPRVRCRLRRESRAMLNLLQALAAAAHYGTKKTYRCNDE